MAEASPNEAEAPRASLGSGASSAGAANGGAGGVASSEAMERDLELASAGVGGSDGASSPSAASAAAGGQGPGVDAGSKGDPGDNDGEEPQEAVGAGPGPVVSVGDAGAPPGGSDGAPPEGLDDGTPSIAVDVVVGECQGFAPCGGDLEGVWTYTAACVDPAELGVDAAQLALCPGVNVALSGEVSGTLSFADGRMTRRGQSVARGQIAVPALCALVLGGCAGVTRELVNGGLTGATCSAGGGLFPSCNCRFSLVAPAIEDVAFETNGGVLRLSNGRTFEYCVDGDELSYAETGAALEPGQRQLSR